MKQVTVNGETHPSSAATVAQLLEELSLPPAMVLVEHNGMALHRSEWAEVPLAEGDRLEILKVAAGG